MCQSTHLNKASTYKAWQPNQQQQASRLVGRQAGTSGSSCSSSVHSTLTSSEMWVSPPRLSVPSKAGVLKSVYKSPAVSGSGDHPPGCSMVTVADGPDVSSEALTSALKPVSPPITMVPEALSAAEVSGACTLRLPPQSMKARFRHPKLRPNQEFWNWERRSGSFGTRTSDSSEPLPPCRRPLRFLVLDPSPECLKFRLNPVKSLRYPERMSN